MLAEFLPESTSLLHLDLTQNNLGMAGVMALSNGLKVRLPSPLHKGLCACRQTKLCAAWT